MTFSHLTFISNILPFIFIHITIIVTGMGIVGFLYDVHEKTKKRTIRFRSLIFIYSNGFLCYTFHFNQQQYELTTLIPVQDNANKKEKEDFPYTVINYIFIMHSPIILVFFLSFFLIHCVYINLLYLIE